MIIIGCDYHPGFQQIVFVDTDTGELQERRLEHREEAEKLYRDLGAQGAKVRIGMEASGHARWFERILSELHVNTKLPGQQETRNIAITVPQRKARKGRPPLIGPKSVSHRMLTPRVGLLKVPFFPGSFGIRFSKLLKAAVEDLQTKGCDRLIIDLRGCLGGSLGFANLVSYLCPDQIPIGYDVTRKRLQRGYTTAELPRVPMPQTKAGVLLCLARFAFQDKSLMLLTQGLGRQPFHRHAVLLVNEFTNSAGEMAAQFAKDTKLATLVGQKTMGIQGPKDDGYSSAARSRLSGHCDDLRQALS